MSWHLRVVYLRLGAGGPGYFVVGYAVGQPDVRWGPFATEAAADAHHAFLRTRVVVP